MRTDVAQDFSPACRYTATQHTANRLHGRRHARRWDESRWRRDEPLDAAAGFPLRGLMRSAIVGCRQRAEGDASMTPPVFGTARGVKSTLRCLCSAMLLVVATSIPAAAQVIGTDGADLLDEI